MKRIGEHYEATVYVKRIWPVVLKGGILLLLAPFGIWKLLELVGVL